MPKPKTVDMRRQARMAALQALFASDIKRAGAEKTGTEDSGDASCLDWLAQEDQLSQEAVEFAGWLLDGVGGKQASLDEVTQRYAPAWPVAQLALVDRNILRIALFELLHNPATPRKTAINEAVELAKVFGSESSARFINGVLGSVMSGLEMGELAAENPAPEGR